MNIKNITEDMIQEFAESKKILARGIDYVKRDMIQSLELVDEKILARVRGSTGVYTIEISVDDAGLKASCDCPYNKDNCKHTVAVLYKWLESNVKTETVDDDDVKFDHLTKEELIGLLKKVPKEIIEKLHN